MSVFFKHEHKLKPIANIGTYNCNICRFNSSLYVVKARDSFKILLIPFFNWGEKLRLVCSKCKAYRELTIEEFNAVLKLPTTFVNKDMIIKREWYEYPAVWIFSGLLVITITLISLLFIPSFPLTSNPTTTSSQNR